MIDIFLKDQFRRNSEKIIEEFFGKDKQCEMALYMEKTSNNFPSLKSITCKQKLSKLEFILWVIKRLILDVTNYFAPRQKLVASDSKELYENFAIKNYQFDTSNRKIVSLIDGTPYYTTLWDRRVEAAQDFMEAILKIEAKSILEVGCGEGVVLFTILQLQKDFLKNKKWVGFDFSIATAMNCKALFENFELTRDEDLKIYNGDATSIHYEDKLFDVSICNSVLDQIKYEKHLALSEMTRVAKYSIIREPLYREQTFSGKTHFKRQDYCRLDLEDLKKFGKVLSVKHCDLGDPTYLHSVILLENY